MAISTLVISWNSAQSADGDYFYQDILFASHGIDDFLSAGTGAGGYIVTVGRDLPNTPVVADVWVKDSTRATTGFRLLASEQFTGDVTLIISPM